MSWGIKNIHMPGYDMKSRAINNLRHSLYKAKQDVTGQIDSKIVTFYQDDAPTSAESSEGDLWVDTNDTNRLYFYSGSEWVDARDTISNWSTVVDDDGNKPDNNANKTMMAKDKQTSNYTFTDTNYHDICEVTINVPNAADHVQVFMSYKLYVQPGYFIPRFTIKTLNSTSATDLQEQEETPASTGETGYYFGNQQVGDSGVSGNQTYKLQIKQNFASPSWAIEARHCVLSIIIVTN